ncbi:unnamed protein product [Rhizophagus irregularis]|uniref:p450-domain-containing protein n=1 Tax=Rhizophagus irregularis TaxID=588596 RepID=A0A2N1MNK6_9GLOM|nr:p450-domain-containing protein [Rhizophagus irregularis]CAB4378828.1 unnamed protein product [Rhizophagus irregularis]CAB5371389.1 unnamed protein product [Rhizophagus irregularis]
MQRTTIEVLGKLAFGYKFGCLESEEIPHIINSTVIVNAWQIHHNPQYWENPKQYNPERFLNNEKRHPFAWIPFSAGPRNCLGQNFSLMEQKVIISMLLLKYNWTLPDNSINKDKLLLAPQFLLRPVDLKLIFTERIN